MLSDQSVPKTCERCHRIRSLKEQNRLPLNRLMMTRELRLSNDKPFFSPNGEDGRITRMLIPFSAR